MVAIVLCDDDPFTLQLLSELLERAIRQSKAEANLSVWPLLVRSRSSLSAAVEAISIFSIMTWEGIPPNGVDLVRQIYHTDPGGKIGFVTGHGEKGMDILRSGVRPSRRSCRLPRKKPASKSCGAPPKPTCPTVSVGSPASRG